MFFHINIESQRPQGRPVGRVDPGRYKRSGCRRQMGWMNRTVGGKHIWVRRRHDDGAEVRMGGRTEKQEAPAQCNVVAERETTPAFVTTMNKDFRGTTMICLCPSLWIISIGWVTRI